MNFEIDNNDNISLQKQTLTGQVAWEKAINNVFVNYDYNTCLKLYKSSGIQYKIKNFGFVDTLNSIIQYFKRQKVISINLNWLDVSNVKNMYGAFSGLNNTLHLIEIDLWNTENVVDMSSMFSNSYINVNLSNWNVTNVKSMSSMFKWTKGTAIIDNWNVLNVENMNEMFKGSNIKWKAFHKGSIANLDLVHLQSMDEMFAEYDGNLDDITKWKLYVVQLMRNLFRNVHNFKVNFFIPK